MLKELLFKYRSVILIFLLVIILLGVYFLAGDHFRHGAEKNASPAFSRSNTMDLDHMNLLDTKVLLVCLDEESVLNAPTDMNVLSLKPAELLSKETIMYLKKSEGTIILISSDPTLSARAWMLLAQKGIIKLFILSGNEDLENIKYKFRPDTITVG